MISDLADNINNIFAWWIVSIMKLQHFQRYISMRVHDVNFFLRFEKKNRKRLIVSKVNIPFKRVLRVQNNIFW